jgi:hypothetical protein
MLKKKNLYRHHLLRLLLFPIGSAPRNPSPCQQVGSFHDDRPSPTSGRSSLLCSAPRKPPGSEGQLECRIVADVNDNTAARADPGSRAEYQ